MAFANHEGFAYVCMLIYLYIDSIHIYTYVSPVYLAQNICFSLTKLAVNHKTGYNLCHVVEIASGSSAGAADSVPVAWKVAGSRNCIIVNSLKTEPQTTPRIRGSYYMFLSSRTRTHEVSRTSWGEYLGHPERLGEISWSTCPKNKLPHNYIILP